MLTVHFAFTDEGQAILTRENVYCGAITKEIKVVSAIGLTRKLDDLWNQLTDDLGAGTPGRGVDETTQK